MDFLFSFFLLLWYKLVWGGQGGLFGLGPAEISIYLGTYLYPFILEVVYIID